MEGHAAYLDFDLRFTRDDGGFRAEILGSPGGGGHRVFQLPWGEHELENYLLKIGQRRSGMRKTESAESGAAREFGNKLFETVFAGDLQNAFRKSVETARAGGNGLRLRLHLDDTPELADLPWEYLYQAKRREFLALSTETPIVRYFDLPETVKPLAVTPPLRVLVMLSNPSDVDCLDVEKEWQKLKEAVRYLEERNLLIVERLERATLSQLQNRLRKEQYHVFHFVGHGSFDPVTQESVLALEDEDRRKRLVSGPDLGIYLRDEPALRLVLLNACEGGRASRTDPFSGAAQSLVLKGIPAVIAMQFEVSDEAAIALASGFYAALADDYPVDAALTEARKAVFAAGCSVEWGTPVLYLRAPDGRIFDVHKTDAQKAEPALRPATPPPLPPVAPPPQRVFRPDPVSVVTTSRERPEKPGSRPWVWMLVGMAVMLTTIISVFGYFVVKRMEEQRSRAVVAASPTPPAEPTPEPTSSPSLLPEVTKFQPEATAATNVALPTDFAKRPLIGSSATPPNANDAAAIRAEMDKLTALQAEMSTKLTEMDQDARNALAGIRSGATSPANAARPDQLPKGQPGAAAGSSFRLVGWWGVVAYPPFVVSRLQFQANGRFAGVGVHTNGQTMQISGRVTYDASSSILSANYDDGTWFRGRIVKWGQGFYTSFPVNGTQVELYFEPED